MKIIDLSLMIYSGMKVYPEDPEVEVSIRDSYEEKGWELRELKFGSHTGSHVDSFSHMHPGKESVDQLPLNRFFGPAERVLIEGDWPTGIGLFFTEMMNFNILEAILEKKPPFVGGTMSEKLERALLANGIITYTNLVNLEKVPLKEKFTFYGLPLKIKDGDGSPVRAMAVIE